MTGKRSRSMWSFVLTGVVAASLVAGAPAKAAPRSNLQAILRPVAGGAGDGFGLVKFRQPKDSETIVFLDVWVRDLAPNHAYFLERATDPIVDDRCAGTNWLRLGQGPAPQAFTTDDRGTGRADLFRSLAAIPLGTSFDIRFRVTDAVTSAVVLESACYQFTVSR